MNDQIENQGLEPEDFGKPLSDPAGLDPRARRKRRLLWTLALLVVGAVAGGVLGWSSEEPVYRGEGLIYIAPSMPSPEDPAGTHVLPMFKGFVAYQVNLANSPRMTLLAMDTDDWRKTGQPSGPEGLSAFQARRRVFSPEETQHIELYFVDPDAEVARAGVRAMIEAYLQLSEDLNDANESLEYARAQCETLTSRIKAASDQVLTFTDPYGGAEGLSIRHRASLERSLRIEEELRAAQDEIQLHSESRSLGPRVEAMRAKEQLLQKRLEHLLAESRELGSARVKVERMNAGVADLEKLLRQMTALRAQLTAQLVGKGRVTVADPGTLPSEYYRDDCRANAATWAGFGALPGLIALLVTAWRGRRSKRATPAA